MPEEKSLLSVEFEKVGDSLDRIIMALGRTYPKYLLISSITIKASVSPKSTDAIKNVARANQPNTYSFLFKVKNKDQHELLREKHSTGDPTLNSVSFSLENGSLYLNGGQISGIPKTKILEFNLTSFEITNSSSQYICETPTITWITEEQANYYVEHGSLPAS